MLYKDDKLELLQNIELDMLIRVKEICEQIGVKYWLAYGTLLGAVRHQGFIPWDDDVDIYILGKDYPKLRQYFNNHDTGCLEFHDYQTKNGYPLTFPKIIDKRTKLKEKRFAHLDYTGGVCIDIFPLFSVSNNRLVRYFENKIRYVCYGIIEAKYLCNTSFKYRIMKNISNMLFNEKKVQMMLERFYCKSSRNLYMNDPLQFDDKKMYPRELFDESIELTFENNRIPSPKGYEKYLQIQYGNYMELPPVEERVPCHNTAILEFEDTIYNKA